MGITIVNQSNAELSYQIFGGGTPSGSGAWPSGSGAWPSGSGAWPSGSGRVYGWGGSGVASGVIPSGVSASGIPASGYPAYTVVLEWPEPPYYTVSGSGIVTVITSSSE